MQASELERFSLFAGLAPGQLKRLAAQVTALALPAGVQIFAAGERATRLYILCSGEVVIRYQPYDGGTLDLVTLQPGDTFGWSAALQRACYTSSAICRSAVGLLSLPAEDLHQVLADDPALATVLLERTALIAGSRLDSLGRQVLGLLRPQSRGR